MPPTTGRCVDRNTCFDREGFQIEGHIMYVSLYGVHLSLCFVNSGTL